MELEKNSCPLAMARHSTGWVPSTVHKRPYFISQAPGEPSRTPSLNTSVFGQDAMRDDVCSGGLVLNSVLSNTTYLLAIAEPSVKVLLVINPFLPITYNN